MMKEISEIKCPLCGMTLVCLSDTEEAADGEFRFWCGECEIDITVEPCS